MREITVVFAAPCNLTIHVTCVNCCDICRKSPPPPSILKIENIKEISNPFVPIRFFLMESTNQTTSIACGNVQ